jgi:sarcosine oxidase
MQHFDVIVAGLGVMGSAALWQLSKSGVRVLGLEAGGPAHHNGSSHGGTRIFRRAYAEGPLYLPLLSLAHSGWRELQSSTEQPLMIPTGGVFIGPAATGFAAGSLRTAVAGNIEHALWEGAEMGQRLPQFNLEPGMQAVFEPGAYVLASDAARLQLLDEAVRSGARVQYGSTISSIAHTDAGLRVTTGAGDALACKAAILTTGAWLGELLPELAAHLSPKHVPVYWFAPRPGCEAQFAADRFAVFVYECGDGTQLYGIPAQASAERGVKIGIHNRQQLPWDAGRKPTLTEELRAEAALYVARVFPDLLPQPIAAKWCIYTFTPDGSFLIGTSQRLPGVHYASACSGHGFKFAPAIGGVLAALALQQPLPVAIDAFALERFGGVRGEIP